MNEWRTPSRAWTVDVHHLAHPVSIAFRAAASPARCAANGVLFRDPLNPWLPELAPYHRVAAHIGNGHNRIIERCLDMRHSAFWTILRSFFFPFFTS